MEIKFVELKIKWPKEITILKLRDYVFSELSKYGSPLRWAITSLETPSSCKGLRIMQIEAVIQISKSKLIR